MPAARAVHVFDKRGGDSGFRGLLRVARGLRHERYELAVLPHQSVRSAALAFLAAVPRRIGFSRAPGSFLYTRRVRTRARGFLDREADLLLALGARPGRMRLSPRPEWTAAVRERFKDGGRYAALCIGSEWETKIWPPERYAALARILSAKGLVPVLFGGPKDRALAAQIPGAIDTVGNPIGEALAILARCELCVGGDTGLVHAARALGVPTVALFGPTSSKVHAFDERTVPVSLGLDCSPCSLHGGRRCPLGHHRCMRDLDEERVARACQAVLSP
jgi:heptosyltransferase-2